MTVLIIIFVISAILTLASLIAVVYCSPWSQAPGSPAVVGAYSKGFFVRSCIALSLTTAGTLLAGYALATA